MIEDQVNALKNMNLVELKQFDYFKELAPAFNAIKYYVPRLTQTDIHVNKKQNPNELAEIKKQQIKKIVQSVIEEERTTRWKNYILKKY